MRAVPRDYEFVSPATLDGVLALLAREPGMWKPIAGGTELMVGFAAGKLPHRKLVNIFGLRELGGILETAQGLRVGAGCTYTALRGSALLARDFPLLGRAASWTGSIANQNRGTLGGNLVNGSPAADTPPALLAYAAEIEVGSVRGTRRLRYAEFHTGYKQNLLAADELLLAVHLPRAAYDVHYLRKVGPRLAQAISKVALGAVGSLHDGRIQTVRLGLASVHNAPYRCLATEAFLNGRRLEDVARAREVLEREIHPLDDIRSTAAYRTQVAGNLLEEFLAQLKTVALARETGRNPAGTLPAAPSHQDLLHGDAETVQRRLLACCGSRRWAEELAARRPFPVLRELLAAAEPIWFALPEADWLQAFACHPRIGDREAPANTNPQSAAFSAAEQRAAQATLEEVAERLAGGNQEYERRFGFRYLVFADGRTAPALLATLEDRLGKTRDQELAEAARQQWAITRLRLTRHFGDEDSSRAPLR